MQLQNTLPVSGAPDAKLNLEFCPSKPAVFAVHLDAVPGQNAQPYLGRTSNLHRRLARLLGESRPGSRLLNLRAQARRVEFTCTGSNLESLWLLYLLNREYYPKTYRQRLRLKPPALLKLNLRNRFPRLYPTRRLSNDGSEYYGPFSSRVAA
ncbi:MAG TPA: hypothetical protein VFM21_05060, partial [Terriglobia bacterium]|nr:hypothetical protein [Terriglobia bacterium]